MSHKTHIYRQPTVDGMTLYTSDVTLQFDETKMVSPILVTSDEN